MDTSISMEELQAEYSRLDVLRKPAPVTELTDEQFKLLDYARSNDNPVPFSRLSAWWAEKGWGNVKLGTLKARYYAEKLRRG